MGVITVSWLKDLKRVKAFRIYAKVTLIVIGLLGLVAGVVAISKNNSAQASGDCDNNAIVRCGVTRDNLKSKYNSLDAKGKAAYAHAGANPNTCSNLTLGSVTKQNTVIVGNKVVANDAWSYGRQNIPPSTQIPGGAWMRRPSVSFRSSSLQALVCMDGSQYKWAVILSCGNPIKAAPTTHPRVKLTKTVNKNEVKLGEKFVYTVITKNIGDVALKNVVTKDLLPNGIVMYNGAKGNPRIAKYGTLQPGQQKVWKLEVKAVEGVKYNTRLKNLACVTTNFNKTLPICDDAYVVVRKKNHPNIRIKKEVNVFKPIEVNQEFTYTIKVTNTGNVKLTNAKITDRLPNGVVAVDNPESRTVSFTIASLAPGQTKSRSFKAKATENAEKGVKLVNVACVVSDQTPKEVCDDVPVTLIPEKPFYACDLLSIKNLGGRKYRFTVNATAVNGANIKFYNFNFDDGTDIAVTDKTSVEHTYASGGKYNPFVTVTVEVDGEEFVAESENCQGSITISTPEKPEEFVGKGAPLPDTGAGDIAGIFLATTLAGSLAYRFVWIKRYN